MNTKDRQNTIILALGITFLMSVVLLSLTVGAYSINFSELFYVLTGQEKSNTQATAVIWQIRFPRVVSAAIAGAALSLSGACIQGIFRNPLADAGLIGVSGGSMLGAALYIVLGAGIGLGMNSYLSQWGVSVFAFLGGLGSTVLVYNLAGGKGQVLTMLLAGVAITSVCGALTGLMTYFSTESQLRDLSFWNLGSFSASNYNTLLVLTMLSLPSGIIIIKNARVLDSLLLGEDEASFMGVNVSYKRWILITSTAILVGSTVAVSGMIGFVGLVVPHLIRMWRGASHRFLLLASAILGAILLLAADTMARTIVAPAELPIGIITALLGAPFFFGLIIKTNKGL